MNEITVELACGVTSTHFRSDRRLVVCLSIQRSVMEFNYMSRGLYLSARRTVAILYVQQGLYDLGVS